MTKSRVIWDQGCPEVGRGLNKSAGGELEDLFWLQTDYIETFTDILYKKRLLEQIFAGGK